MEPQYRETKIGEHKYKTKLWTGRKCLRFGIYVKARILAPVVTMISNFKDANLDEYDTEAETVLEMVKRVKVPAEMADQLTVFFDSLDSDDFERFLFGPADSPKCAGGFLENLEIDGREFEEDDITSDIEFYQALIWMVQVNYTPFLAGLAEKMESLKDGLSAKLDGMGINLDEMKASPGGTETENKEV